MKTESGSDCLSFYNAVKILKVHVTTCHNGVLFQHSAQPNNEQNPSKSNPVAAVLCLNLKICKPFCKSFWKPFCKSFWKPFDKPFCKSFCKS